MSRVSIARKAAIELLEFCKTNSEDEFFFAKDHGAYFGATAGSNETKDFRNCIMYINGMDPEKDEYWYETADGLFGGDDFGEILPIAWLETFVMKSEHAKHMRFTIEITPKEIKLIL